MKILVTAGNTQTPIDKVRCLTNIFTGRTGARIAIEAVRRGHTVKLFTSQPEPVAQLGGWVFLPQSDRPIEIETFRTFDDLSRLLENTIPEENFDVIIHAAAVSDYALEGVFAKDDKGKLIDVSAGKVKSHHAELWLKLVPTPKLVDRIRGEWGFKGVLVKFKLEVGVSDNQLLDVAEKSRVQSGADLMVANTLEGMNAFAYLGPVGGRYEKVERSNLARRLLEAVEQMRSKT